MAWRLTLALRPETYAVCRLAPDAPLPAWAEGGSFVSITRTRDELSIVAPQARVPDGVQAERGWRCLSVEGPFDLDGVIGVLAALAVPLAEAEISIFAVSSYDTDHLLLKDQHLQRAVEVLERAGHLVRASAHEVT
jgi:uncharacterized protein